MLQLKEYLDKAISYDEYMQIVENEANSSNEKAQFSALNLKRMQRLNKTFSLNDQQIDKLKSIPKDCSLLVITETWCGDASQILPVLHKISEAVGSNMKLLFRDDNPELMQEYSYNGTQSIPIVIGIHNTNFKEAFRWGPRTKTGTELLKKFKENPVIYSKEKFHIDLQQFYNHNKGQEIFEEIVEKCERVC